MEIHIVDDWYLRSDKYCLIVARKVKVQQGKTAGQDRWVDEFYPTSISRAVVSLLERGVRLSDATDVKELARHQESLAQRLIDQYDRLDREIKEMVRQWLRQS